MGKRIRDYVKYSLSELEDYTKRAESCVKKVKNGMHLNLPPYALGNIKKTILDVIATKKIGFFDIRLQGIILDIRNIKILGDLAPISYCDPNVHLNIEADFYIFQPELGAVVRGVVKHISSRQIGVIIYRVFSVSIRLKDQVDRNLKLNSEIEFRIKNFDLQNVMPFIEGELVGSFATYSKEGSEMKTDVSVSKFEEFQNKTLDKQESIETVSSSNYEEERNNSYSTTLDGTFEQSEERKPKKKSKKPKTVDIKEDTKSSQQDQCLNASDNLNTITSNMTDGNEKDISNILPLKRENITCSVDNSSDNESVDIFANHYSDSEEVLSKNSQLDITLKRKRNQKINETSSQKKKQKKHAIKLEIEESILNEKLELLPKIKKEEPSGKNCLNVDALQIASGEENEHQTIVYRNIQATSDEIVEPLSETQIRDLQKNDKLEKKKKKKKISSDFNDSLVVGEITLSSVKLEINTEETTSTKFDIISCEKNKSNNLTDVMENIRNEKIHQEFTSQSIDYNNGNSNEYKSKRTDIVGKVQNETSTNVLHSADRDTAKNLKKKRKSESDSLSDSLSDIIKKVKDQRANSQNANSPEVQDSVAAAVSKKRNKRSKKDSLTDVLTKLTKQIQDSRVDVEQNVVTTSDADDNQRLKKRKTSLPVAETDASTMQIEFGETDNKKQRSKKRKLSLSDSLKQILENAASKKTK